MLSVDSRRSDIRLSNLVELIAMALWYVIAHGYLWSIADGRWAAPLEKLRVLSLPSLAKCVRACTTVFLRLIKRTART